MHFVDATGQLLRKDEVSSPNLPAKDRPFVESAHFAGLVMDEPLGECKGIQTDGPSMDVIERLLKQEKEKNAVLTEQLNYAETKLVKIQFRLANIETSDSLINFYTGFPSFFALKFFYKFLGPPVDNLVYLYDDSKMVEEVNRCRPRVQPPTYGRIFS